jgi:hypothetical protein
MIGKFSIKQMVITAWQKQNKTDIHLGSGFNNR